MEQVSPPTTQPIAEPIPQMGETPKKSFTPPSIPKLPVLPIKKIAIGLGAVVLIGVFAVVGKMFLGKTTVTPTITNRPITLTYWGMMENTKELQAIFTDFESQNPGVKVEYSYQSPKDYSDRLVSACSRNQCPDIFRFHSTWTSQYVSKGLLSSLPTNVMSAGEYEKTFYPVVVSDLKTSTGYVGIPLMYDGLGLFVNKRILQDSGKPAPTTWDELRILARDLTVRGAGNSIERAGIALGAASNVDHFSDILAILILQNGGNPGKPEAFGSNSTSGPNAGKSSLVGDALTFYTQFSRDDKVWDETLPNSTYAFAIERVAMVIAPAYRAAEVKKLNPNFSFEVYPIPQLPGKPITFANYWVEGVSKSSKEQDMAWKLLKFLSGKPQLAKLFPAGSTRIPSRTDMADTLLTDPYVGAIVRQAPNSKSFYMSSRTFDKGINDKMIEAYSDLITKMQVNGRYDSFAGTFSTNIAKLVASFGIKP